MSILISRLSYHELTNKWDAVKGVYKPRNEGARRQLLTDLYDKSLTLSTIDLIRPHVLFNTPESYLENIARGHAGGSLHVKFRSHHPWSSDMNVSGIFKVSPWVIDNILSLLNEERTPQGAPRIAELLFTLERY